MPPAPTKGSAPLHLVHGEDEFAVKQKARQIFNAWIAESPGMDQEIIDASAANSGEALNALRKLREAMQTLPFFGGAKVIWFQNCNFLGEERAASTAAVTETLGSLADELKRFKWDGVKLLISAGKVDRRKTFYKTLEKLGQAEGFSGWSAEDKEWNSEAEFQARGHLKELGKDISEEALALLVANVGPNSRQLHNEVEKLSLSVGDRPKITAADVERIVTRNKQSRAFALADALGERNLPKLLKRLDEELWEVRLDSSRSEIGLLYGIISKVRAMIFLKELVARGSLKAGSDYSRFKSQIAAIPRESLPADKRFNPLDMHVFVLFQAMGHAQNYTIEELVRAMDHLLSCNLLMVSSGQEQASLLQQTLVKIVQRPDGQAAARRAA